MKIFIALASAFVVGLIVLGLGFMPALAQGTAAGDAIQINPPSPRGNVPGEYIVMLKNETFAEVDEQFPDKEKVMASNIPEENAQVDPAMKLQFDVQTTEVVLENVQEFNGTTPEEYPTSPLGEQGAKADSIFTYAIKGYTVVGVNDPSIFVGNENISTVEQSHYKEPAAQYLPLAMDRGDSEKMANPCNIDNKEGNCNVDVAVIDAQVYPHPDLNVLKTVSVMDSGWRVSTSSHGMGNAGVCCARDNLGGVVGSAPGARIWGLTYFGSPPGQSLDVVSTSSSHDIRALNYVIANAASIEVANWNVQCGGGANTCPLLSSVNTAANNVVSAGVTLFTAAGNGGVNTDGVEQCGYTATICVGAYGDMDGLCGGKSSQTYVYGVGPDNHAETGRDDRIAVFSNFGDSVDIAGHGYPSLSTAIPPGMLGGGASPSIKAGYPYIGGFVQDNYQFYSGTSQANPSVSGIGAVIKASNPSFTPAQVRSALLAEAVPVTESCDGSSKGGYVVSVPSEKNAPLAYAGDY